MSFAADSSRIGLFKNKYEELRQDGKQMIRYRRGTGRCQCLSDDGRFCNEAGDGCRQAGLYREQKGGDSQRHQNFRGHAGGGNDCRFYFSGS